MFQGLFHKRSSKSEAEKAVVNETLRTLIDARFDRIEAKVNTIELEWADVYDKIKLLYDRTRKRIKQAEKASEGTDPVRPLPTPPLTRENVLRAFDELNGRNF